MVSPGVDTTGLGGSAVVSQIAAGDWIINNNAPGFPIIGDGGAGNHGIHLPGPNNPPGDGITSYTLNNANAITGPTDGVNSVTTGSTTINNQAGGTITGTSNNGIRASSGTGGAGAIELNNSSSTSTITGAERGAFLTADGAVTVTNSGSIQGSGNHGLSCSSDTSTVSLTNNSTGTVTGDETGVFLSAEGALTVTNSGPIQGNMNAGVFAISNSTVIINNSGPISSTTGAALFLDGVPTSQVTHTINLMTGSVLTPGGTTAIAGATDTDVTTTINLSGTGPADPLGQEGAFTTINTLNNTGVWNLTPGVTPHQIDRINVTSGTFALNGQVVQIQDPNIPPYHETNVLSGATLSGNSEFGTLGSGDADLFIQAGAFHKPGNSIGTTEVAGLYSLAGELEVEFDPSILFPVPAGVAIPGGPTAYSTDFVYAEKVDITTGATIDASNVSMPASPVVASSIFPFLYAEDEFKVNTVVATVGAMETCDPSPAAHCWGITKIRNNIHDGFKLILAAFGGLDDGNDVLLALYPTPVSIIDLLNSADFMECNGRDFAVDLDTFTPTPGSQLEALKNLILGSSPNEAAEIIREVVPTFYGYTHRSLSDFQADRSKEITRALAKHRNNNPPPRRNSLWASPFMNITDRENQSQFPGLDARTYGITVGMDRFFWNPHFQLGGILAYGNTSVDMKLNLGSAEINTISWGAYTSYKSLNDEHEGYFMDASFVAGYHDFDSKRSIPSLSQVANSSNDGWSFDARIGGGYNILLSDILLSPFAYGDFLFTQINGFTETGAPLANLSLKKRDEEAIRLEVGSTMSQSFKLSECVVLQPELSLSWIFKKPINGQRMKASFPSGFNFTAQSFDRTQNQFCGGADLTMIIRDHLFLGLFYSGEVGDNEHSHKAGLKGSYRF